MLFVILSFQYSYSQEQTQKYNVDSLYTKMKYAFELNLKNRVHEAVKICDAILLAEQEQRNDSLRGSLYVVLGVSSSMLNNEDESIDYFRKSTKIFQALNMHEKLMGINNNLGVVYRKKGDFKNSNKYFNLAAKQSEKINKPEYKAHPLHNIAQNIIKTSGNPDEALRYVLQAKKYAEQEKDQGLDDLKSEILATLGEIYTKKKEYKKAEDCLNQSLKISQENDYFDRQAIIFYNLAELNELKGNHEIAKKFYQKNSKIKESIFNMKKQAQSNEVELEFKSQANKKKIQLMEQEEVLKNELIEKAEANNLILMLLSFVLLSLGAILYNSNKKLSIAKTKIEKISKVRSDFYSEISHELRTPLHTIIQLTSILSKEIKNLTHLKYLNSLKYSGRNLMHLINNILELNKMESGNTVTIVEQEFLLSNLLKEVTSYIKHDLYDSNNSVNTMIDTNLPNQLIGDKSKISHILINLVSNANKYTNNGEISIELTQKSIQKNSVTVNFKVKDNGIGISKRKQALIFDSFYQDNSRYSRSYKGTGLGLSIVKYLLSQFNSKIELESKKNEGTSFSFNLDLKFTDKVLHEVEKQEAAVKDISGSKILIVDDNKINRLITEKALTYYKNVEVVKAVNGHEAISLVKNQYFDVVLMDVNMPDINGFEAAKAIRQFNKQVSILMLSAITVEELELQANKNIVDGYVLKPFNNSDLINKIASTLIRKNGN